MDEDFVNSQKFVFIQSIPTAFLILFPPSMKRDMSAFKYASLISIGCLSYTGIVLIIEMPKYYGQNKDQDWNLVNFDFNLFTGASMTFFAF